MWELPYQITFTENWKQFKLGVCWPSSRWVKNLYSYFPHKNIKSELYKTIISPVWCGFEVLSVIVMKEYTSRKFYSRPKVCGRYLDQVQRKQPEDEEKIYNEHWKIGVVKWRFFFLEFTNIKQRQSFRGWQSQIIGVRMGFIHDLDELLSVWAVWLCSLHKYSHLYIPGGSVDVSRQANLVQGHTAHMMSPVTWRGSTRIHDSSLSFLISYSVNVFTTCWTTTPSMTIQNILLHTSI